MIIGFIIISVFFISLPWVWYSIPSIVGVALRPSVVASLPLLLYFFWKNGLKLKETNISIMVFLGFTFIIWILPSFLHDSPHWSTTKVLSVFVYVVLSYFSARMYLIVSNDKQWNKYWPYIGLLFLISCVYSFYTVFGTLIPNTNITSSSGFIQNSLYGHMFDPSKNEGRGIRHTMAIVPTLLLALTIHNRNISPKINSIIFVVVLYLILYTFSRSAWVVAILMMFLLVKLNIKDINKNVMKLVFLGFTSMVVILGVFIAFPEKLSWLGQILSDRVSDSQSTDGRLWVLMHTFTNTTVSEYIIGNNNSFQQSPHNMMLDALMQSGIIGFICAIIIFFYSVKFYKKGLFGRDMSYIVPAAFITPALVRMLTAGSGMLHIAELFGLCVAANILLFSSDSKNKYKNDECNYNGDNKIIERGVQLR